MASKLGALIRAKRTKKGITLRGLARAIDKSPAFITRLECEDVFPAMSSETLKAIALAVDIEPDTLLIGAGRAQEVEPKTELELALYRKVQGLPKKEQQKLLEHLSQLKGREK